MHVNEALAEGYHEIEPSAIPGASPTVEVRGTATPTGTLLGEGTPGFGVLAAVGALGTIAAAALYRGRNESEDKEE